MVGMRCAVKPEARAERHARCGVASLPLKPEARAEGGADDFTGWEAYSLSLRFGLPGRGGTPVGGATRAMLSGYAMAVARWWERGIACP
jgi:hypothetical protein